MKKYGFGVDIGGTTVKLGIFQMDGRLLEKWEIPTDTTNSGAAILDDVAASISGKMQERKIFLWYYFFFLINPATLYC